MTGSDEGALHLIGLEEMTREAMVSLLDKAEEYLDESGKVFTPPERRRVLEGTTIALLFMEPSTRTRASFHLALRRLGADVFELHEATSSLQKGESVSDTCRTLAAMGVDGFVVRHSDRQWPHVLRDHLRVPVINAGNGSGEHPTQGLLDALTLRRHFGIKDLSGLKVAIMGDIVHSRVARSDTLAFARLGAEVRLVGPSMLLPTEERLPKWPARMGGSRKEALRWADAVVVLRIQHERMHGQLVDPHQYAMEWGIDSSAVDLHMSPRTVILHPGPVIRGVEVSDPVIDSERSLIFKQVVHGVALRQAIAETYFLS